MAAISREEVAHIAQLSRLAVTDEELDVFSAQLAVILESVTQLGSVMGEPATKGTAHALQNVYREDVQVPCLTQEAALSNAPDEVDGRFRVPRILEED